MNQAVAKSLERSQTIDITTSGRRSGKKTRIELGLLNLDGDLYITGRPGRRDWYANVTANPNFIVHLKRDLRRDVPAVAEPITDPEERRTILWRILTEIWDTEESRARQIIDRWVSDSPLVRVRIVPSD